MLASSSQYAQNVDTVMTYIVGVSIILIVGIVGTMIYFVFKYSKQKNKKAKQIEGNTLLETIWIAIPLILVLTMFYYGYVVFLESREIPPNSYEIKVEARMWAWKFTYPNGKVSDTLFVPLNKPIKFTISSIDVVHSFYIPSFRIKEDAVPGKTNYMVIEPRQVGAYDVACAEYCGLNHSLMYTKMYVVPENDLNNWLSTGQVSESVQKLFSVDKSKYKQLSESAFALLSNKACIQCHSIDNSSSIGPSFTQLNRVMAKVTIKGKDTTVVIDENYLRRAIMDPNYEIVEGFGRIRMPDQSNNVNQKELEELIRILKDNFVKK